MNLGGHLKGQTHRRQRGNDGAIPIHRRSGEEVATFKNTDSVVGSHPLLGQLLHFGQIGIGDYPRLKPRTRTQTAATPGVGAPP